MRIRLGRTQPPAAAPIPLADVLKAVPGCFDRRGGGSSFEEGLRSSFGTSQALLVSSGQAALVVILEALKEMMPGRYEVIVPAYTCYTVPAAIKRAGLKIRLCDTGPGSLDLDPNQLEEIIEEDRGHGRILCLLMTHLYGCPSDVCHLRSIVGKEIPIIEDAAQAMGLEVSGAKLGTLGDVGFFSLGRGKGLSTMGGGVILTNRADLGEIIRKILEQMERVGSFSQLKSAAQAVVTTLLQRPEWFWIPKNLPFLKLGETIYEDGFRIGRLGPFHERLGGGWQARLQKHLDARLRNCRFWSESVQSDDLQYGSVRGKLGLIRYPVLLPSVEEKDRILQHSHRAGCGLMSGYPLPINRVREIKQEFAGRSYPNAEGLAERMITLPTHEYLGDRDREGVLTILL